MAAAKLEPPADVKLKDAEGLEDRRQAAQAARHARQGDRQAGLLDGRQDARHAQRRRQGEPGVRRQGEELRRRQGRRHARRQEGRAERRCRGGGDRRHLVAGQERARGAADHLGRRPQRQALERLDRRDAQGRARRARGVRRQQAGRRQGCDRQGGQEGRGGLLLSVPEPRHHGADERDRALHRRQVRGVDQLAERRGRAGSGQRGVRPAGREVRRAQHHPGRRLRPARAQRICRPRGAHRQGDAGHADQADQVARGRHGERGLSPDHPVQARRRASTPTTT